MTPCHLVHSYNGPEESVSTMQIYTASYSKSQQFQEACSSFRDLYIYIYLFIYLLQLGFYPVAVVILHVNKTWNWLLLYLSREGYMRSM